MNKLLDTLMRIAGFLGRDIITLLLLIAVLAGGLYLGYLSGFAAGKAAAPASTDKHAGHEDEDAGPTTWTCSMHPQIQLPKPGKCPICFMDLIPLEKDAGDDAPRRLVMSPAAKALAEIETQPVERRSVTHTLRMVGKVHYDETRLSTIAAWFPGRLDRLYVDYTGITVSKGDHMVYVYSPELLTAQQELLEATKGAEDLGDAGKDAIRMAEELVRSAEEKLRLWGLTLEQIEEIRRKGKAQDHLTIRAPVGGIVIHKNALEGMWVKTGTKIYTIADLSRVWVLLDAYESDLPWVHYQQEVEFTTEAYPDQTFRGKIVFISPVLDERSRTVRLRVNVPNPRGLLKPEMFVRAEIRAKVIGRGTALAPKLAGKWISPMHPEVIKDGPGQCDVCGMDLVPAESLFPTRDTPQEPPVVIPASAALVTGKRAVVYVKAKDTEKPTFDGREIVLGPRAGGYYIVEKGLNEGDLVVVNGAFKIDSALQIQAKPSMMMPAGEDQRPETRDQRPKTEEQRPKTHEVDEAFAKSLDPFLNDYLALQKALAEDKLEPSKENLKRLPGDLKRVEAGALEGDTADQWETISEALSKQLEHAAHVTDFAGIRKLNVGLSEHLIELVKTFGVTGGKALYHAHCPMANDGEGASWLQDHDEVLNPFYGAEMLHCGEIKEAIEPEKAQEHDHGHKHEEQ